MNHAPEHAPAEVFDWLETHRFQDLTTDQQKVVLTFFSEDEYLEFSQVVRALKDGSATANAQSRIRIKQELLNRFDALHPPTDARTLEKAAIWWRAAAVGLLLISSVLTLLLARRSTSDPTSMLTKTDTLYLVKRVASAPEKVYDTVWIQAANPQKSNPKRNPDTLLAISDSPTFQPGPPWKMLEETPVVSLKNMGSQANRPKHNSMHDDTLLRRFSFVTL